MNKAQEELGKLAQALLKEREEDFEQYKILLEQTSIQERKKNGITWFPLRVIETGYGLGEYPYMVVERNDKQLTSHKFQTANPVTLFTISQGNEGENLNGTIGYVDDSRMKITFFADELPEWTDAGKLGVNMLFDTRSYDEMFKALNLLINAEKGRTAKLRDIILGEHQSTFSKKAKRQSSKLNDSQNDALQSILEAEDLALVHGPPGTGKTTTLVESIAELLKEEKQIMVCAPSNAATDHLAKSLHVKGLRVVRIGNLAKVETDNTALTLDVLVQQQKDFKQIRELKRRANELRKIGGKYKRSFGREEAEQRKLILNEARSLSREARDLENYLVTKVLDEAQIIACTLIGSTSDYLRDRQFKTVVIDEAGQGIEPAVWVPILKADKVVMAGDPFQLPPTIKSSQAARLGLDKTLLEKAIQRHTRVNLLDVQYRMHENIMHFSNLKFYGGKLKAHASVAEHHLPTSPQVVELIDTAGCGFSELTGESGESICNPDEVQLIRKHFDTLKSAGNIEFSIAVISPYRAQVELLKQEFETEKNISVNTIDSFQGQERDMVYISLVRSNDQGDIGFLKDYRRMNVAMTRARKKLVMVGDSATLANDHFYNDLLQFTEQINAYRTAWEWMH